MSFVIVTFPISLIALFHLKSKQPGNSQRANQLRRELARISLSLFIENGNLCLYVQDDGCGFLPDEVNQATNSPTNAKVEHFGLTGMSERVKLLGGTLCISSEPGAGTCVAACIPLDQGRGKR